MLPCSFCHLLWVSELWHTMLRHIFQNAMQAGFAAIWYRPPQSVQPLQFSRSFYHILCLPHELLQLQKHRWQLKCMHLPFWHIAANKHSVKCKIAKCCALYFLRMHTGNASKHICMWLWI